jgi:outer membrane receptor protein involved in Fe transport
MKSILSAVIGATLALSAIEAGAQATPGERQVSLTIETGTLANALDKWAQQSGFQIFVQDWEATKNLRAPSLNGTFAAQDALEQLLSGTPLTYVWIDAKTVSIRKKPAQTVPTALQRTSLDGQPGIPVEKFSGDDVRGGAVSQANAGALEDNTGGVERNTRIDRLEEVIVTGTNIAGTTPSASPLTVYDRERIEQSGATTVEQFVRQIPQNFAVVDASTVQGSGNSDSGTNVAFGSGVNMHGLGAGATLVLINGHRASPSGIDGSFVDVSLIPLSAVERIEMLTDGASALYGADAVAGVVNFILRRDFDGAETSLLYGDSADGGATERTIGQTLGTVWDNGSAMITYEYHDQDPLRADQRGFIPPLDARRYILPDQERHSAFVSAQQQLASNTELLVDGFFGKRDFIYDFSTGFGLNHAVGEASQYSASLTANHVTDAGWRFGATASFARSDNSQDSVFEIEDLPPLESSYATRSGLMSIDVVGSGKVLSLPGGDLKASIGVSGRRERFDDDTTAIPSAGKGLERDVASLYGEVLLPLVSDANAVAAVRRLEVSLAARYDEYDQFGSSTNPKVGLLWSPLEALSLRGTYATSFRVPTLSQQSSAGTSYTVFPLPTLDGDSINTIIIGAPGNESLRPEESTSVSAGLDFVPPGVVGLELSMTYYRVHYEDRIAAPPMQSFSPFFEEDVLSPFIDRNPDPQEVERVLALPPEQTFNPFGLQPGDIGAIYDGRLQNIGVSKTSGVDLSASFSRDVGAGTLALYLAGNYMFDLSYQATALSSEVDVVDTVFEPLNLRLRGGLAWSAGGWSSGFAVAYSDSYKNDLVDPAQKISSWTTVDAQVAYEVDTHRASVLRGLSTTLSIQNLFDRDPPTFDRGSPPSPGLYGFDPVNASAVGRMVTLSVRKRW